MYCATVYARSGVNQMWILKNSKELLESLKSPTFSQIYSIKTYDFTTLYTTIPHDKLKNRLFGIIDSCFFNKNGKRKYSYLVVNHSRMYFVIHATPTPCTSTLKLTLKRCWGSSLTTYLQSLVIKFSNRQLESPWVPIVPLCQRTYSY